MKKFIGINSIYISKTIAEYSQEKKKSQSYIHRTKMQHLEFVQNVITRMKYKFFSD
ncbi:MAG: hypothetical protein LBT18_05490 [Endomicrobium sp.]|jgi:hypothetical protein|nr:hypothetical protein [Endomicrobium sp.]